MQARGHVHAVIGATRSSDLFTQDAEDLPPEVFGQAEERRSWEQEKAEDAPPPAAETSPAATASAALPAPAATPDARRPPPEKPASPAQLEAANAAVDAIDKCTTLAQLAHVLRAIGDEVKAKKIHPKNVPELHTIAKDRQTAIKLAAEVPKGREFAQDQADAPPPDDYVGGDNADTGPADSLDNARRRPRHCGVITTATSPLRCPEFLRVGSKVITRTYWLFGGKGCCPDSSAARASTRPQPGSAPDDPTPASSPEVLAREVDVDLDAASHLIRRVELDHAPPACRLLHLRARPVVPLEGQSVELGARQARLRPDVAAGDDARLGPHQDRRALRHVPGWVGAAPLEVAVVDQAIEEDAGHGSARRRRRVGFAKGPRTGSSPPSGCS